MKVVMCQMMKWKQWYYYYWPIIGINDIIEMAQWYYCIINIIIIDIDN